MKSILERLIAFLTSRAIYFLHNRNTPPFTREEIRYLRLSFSQFGEDLALERWFEEVFKIKTGVYVDVGAFHPILLSSTLLLHKKGWHGVNIDMNAAKIREFDRLRPGDINIHTAVGNEPGKAKSSRSGPVEAMIRDPDGDIPIRRLDDIMSETSFSTIDYLNIDCEGFDFEVLKSVTIEKYRPKIITIEALEEEPRLLIESYLKARGYALEEKLHYTLLFVLQEASL